jgi:hypothetical protein
MEPTFEVTISLGRRKHNPPGTWPGSADTRVVFSGNVRCVAPTDPAQLAEMIASAWRIIEADAKELFYGEKK